MGTVCPSDISVAQFVATIEAWHKAAEYSSYLESAIAVICTIVFFGCYHRLKKPGFVMLMWALLITSQVAFFVVTGIMRMKRDAKQDGDLAKRDRLQPYLSESLNVYQVALMSGHWVFAVKYAEVVLKLPLLVFAETAGDIQAALKKIQFVIWILNAFFGAIVVTYTVTLQVYVFKEEADGDASWLNRLGTLMTIAPIVLLLVAVARVRCMVKKLRNKAIFQKEKLILVHAVLFTLYFIFQTIAWASVSFAVNMKGSMPTICKEAVTGLLSDIGLSVINSCVFILITYMSVQFCRPLDGQWQ